MPVKEASSEETLNGRYVTSEGWFVHNLADALAVRNEEKGRRDVPAPAAGGSFNDVGVGVRVVWPGYPSALYHSQSAQEGFSCSRGSGC